MGDVVVKLPCQPSRLTSGREQPSQGPVLVLVLGGFQAASVLPAGTAGVRPRGPAVVASLAASHDFSPSRGSRDEEAQRAAAAARLDAFAPAPAAAAKPMNPLSVGSAPLSGMWASADLGTAQRGCIPAAPFGALAALFQAQPSNSLPLFGCSSYPAACVSSSADTPLFNLTA